MSSMLVLSSSVKTQILYKLANPTTQNTQPPFFSLTKPDQSQLKFPLPPSYLPFESKKKVLITSSVGLFLQSDCLRCRERSYYMVQYQQTGKVEKILLELNKTGLSYLKYQQFREAIQFFKKAQKIVNDQLMVSTQHQKINQLAGVTYNNLACYYKKTRKPKVALYYLKKSLQIQVYKMNDWVSTGSTHLNICAIYSYLDKHQQALSHVKLAAELLQKKHYDDNKKQTQEVRSYWNIKMLCYYNMAIEEEHLKMYEPSLTSYNKAKEVAKLLGTKNLGIIMSCDQAISRIQMHLANLKRKMISYFMKKKQDEQSGHYQYMRMHKPVTKRISKILSQDRINKFSLYQSVDEKRRGDLKLEVKTSKRPNISQAIERRSNSTKFKSLHDYFGKKHMTQTQSEANNK